MSGIGVKCTPRGSLNLLQPIYHVSYWWIVFSTVYLRGRWWLDPNLKPSRALDCVFVFNGLHLFCFNQSVSGSGNLSFEVSGKTRCAIMIRSSGADTMKLMGAPDHGISNCEVEHQYNHLPSRLALYTTVYKMVGGQSHSGSYQCYVRI